MLQDVIKKRKTEIEFLNGKIVNYGKKLNMTTPINEILSELVHGLDYGF